MLINESYFDDLDINDEDVVVDVDNDVEEPKYELTLDEFHKLPEQYNHSIDIDIYRYRYKKIDTTTFIQTILIPKLFKRLDSIFELYGIEHSLYVLKSYYDMDKCNTVVKIGNYQFFCREDEKDDINKTYTCFLIRVFVNYPEFTYKRAFRFIYTVMNLFRIDKYIDSIDFYPLDNDYVTDIYFSCSNLTSNEIRFTYYNNRINKRGCRIFLSNEEELTEKNKREFYKSVFRHFFKKEIRVPYRLIDNDVPLKPIRLQ